MVTSPSQNSYAYDDYSIAGDTAVLGSLAGDHIHPRNTVSPRSSNSDNKNTVENDNNNVEPYEYNDMVIQQQQQHHQQRNTKPPKSSSRSIKTSLVVKTSSNTQDSNPNAAALTTSNINKHQLSQISQQPQQPPIHTYKHIAQKNDEALPTKTLLQLQQHPQSNTLSSIKSPTAFHKALLSNSTTLKSLRVHLLSRPNACSLKDSQGRLPLHLLSLNRSLYENLGNECRIDLMDLIMDIYNEYPMAAVTSDNDGKIPFSYGVIDWVNQYCSCKDNSVDNQNKQQQDDFDDECSYDPTTRNGHNFKSDSSIFPKLFNKNVGDDFSVFSRECRHTTPTAKARSPSPIFEHVIPSKTFTESSPEDKHESNSPTNYGVDTNIADIDGDPTDDESNNGSFRHYHTSNSNAHHWIKSQRYKVTNEQDIDQCLRMIKRNNPKNKETHMPSYVSWSFEILNMFYESIVNDEEGLADEDYWTSTLFINALASIPNLIFLLLFTCNTSTPLKVHNRHKIIHKIMTSSYGIGDWLVYLLERDDICCTKAIQYMNNFDTLQYNGQPEQQQHYNDTIFENIASLEFILPSILLLHKKSTFDKAIHTNVWRYIVNDALHNKLLKWIGTDFIFHLLFLITFQMYANLFITSKLPSSSSEISNDTQGTILECLCLSSLLYLLLRKFNHVISIIKISRINKIFRRNTVSFWDILEWMTYSISIVAIIGFDMFRASPSAQIEEYLRKALIAQLALIYLNFIGWLRIVSYDMALLLRRLGKAIYDIRMHLLVYVIMIISFSHMFHLIESKASCAEDEYTSSLLCANPYLHTYATALGMFDVNDYTTSITSMILFLVFTFIILILLFAILIATVCNTIQQDRLHSTSHVASQKARFIYYAHTTTFDILLTSRWHLIQYCCALLFFSAVGLLLCMTFEIKRQAMIGFYGDMIVLLGIGALLFFAIISSIGFFCHISFYDNRDEKRNSKQSIFRKLLNILCYPGAYFLQSVILGSGTARNEEVLTPREVASTKSLLSSLEKNIIETIKQERIKEQQKNNKAKNNIINELSILDDRLDSMSAEIRSLSNIGFHKRDKDVPTDEDNDYISSDDGTRNNDHGAILYASASSPSSSGRYIDNNTVGIEV